MDLPREKQENQLIWTLEYFIPLILEFYFRKCGKLAARLILIFFGAFPSHVQELIPLSWVKFYKRQNFIT